MKIIIVLLSIVTALMEPTVVKAESQAGPGTCLAFVDNLNVPVLVQMQSTNGSWINAGTTGWQAHMAGYSDYPWIIEPGGMAQILKYYQGAYVVSQNGMFNETLTDIQPPTDSRVADYIFTGHALKTTWAFRPEMTENGGCKGTVVVTVEK